MQPMKIKTSMKRPSSRTQCVQPVGIPIPHTIDKHVREHPGWIYDDVKSFHVQTQHCTMFFSRSLLLETHTQIFVDEVTVKEV